VGEAWGPRLSPVTTVTLLLLFALFGTPPLLAPLLFRVGQGRMAVAGCAALAVAGALLVRMSVSHPAPGQPGPISADLVWLAHAAPAGAAWALVALLFSLTPAGFVFFRHGPDHYSAHLRCCHPARLLRGRQG
jgi:hypothetical protein